MSLAALEELKSRPQWVAYRLEERGGKITKPPYIANSGQHADSTNPLTWRPYTVARAAFKKAGHRGLGFVTTADDPYTGIDLDHCRDAATGAVAEWAQHLVARFDSYTEVTPSDEGLRIWIKATLPDGHSRRGSIELYDRGRYFTVTGRHLKGTPETIEARQAVLEEVCAELWPPKPARKTSLPQPVDLNDAQLIEEACNAKGGDAFGRLWRGDLSDVEGDHSRGDFTLCGRLAFWTAGDGRRMDRMFRSSGLMREKWDERRGPSTYGAITIEEALAGRVEFYSPAGGPSSSVAPTEHIVAASTGPALVVATGQPRTAIPVLDEAAFRGLAGEVVRAIDPHTDADPAAVLVSLLVAFGSAVGDGPHVVVGATHHPAREYVAVVGDTAVARKGESWSPVRRLMARAAPEWADSRVQGGLSSGEGVIASCRDAVEEVDGKTGEQRTTDAGIADKRLLVVEPELARTLRVLKRDGSTLSAILRDAWDSGSLRVMTKAQLRATGTHVCVIGHITETELTRELDESSIGNGFANRFLWIAVRRSKLLPEPEPFDGALVDRLASKVAAAISFGRGLEAVPRDDEAQQVWGRVYPSLTAAKPGLLGAVLSRAEAHAVRLSLIYALLDHSAVIRREHLESALAVVDFAEASARHIFGDRLGDPVADTVFAALADGRELTRNAIRDLFGRHASASRITGALEQLAGSGQVVMEPRETGGRPAEVWRRA